MKSYRTALPTAMALALLAGFFAPNGASAHCDGLDGPVVAAARKALEAGDVNLVLVWVKAEDEAAIRNAFDKMLLVRKLGPEAMNMADMYFYETLVRIHRAGEGAPYTGLKPAGRDLGPALPAADKALADGNIEPVVRLLTETVHEGIRGRFDAAMAKKNYPTKDVQAGREFVEAYVSYIHYVEGLYGAAMASAEGHVNEAAEGKESETVEHH